MCRITRPQVIITANAKIVTTVVARIFHNGASPIVRRSHRGIFSMSLLGTKGPAISICACRQCISGAGLRGGWSMMAKWNSPMRATVLDEKRKSGGVSPWLMRSMRISVSGKVQRMGTGLPVWPGAPGMVSGAISGRRNNMSASSSNVRVPTLACVAGGTWLISSNWLAARLAAAPKARCARALGCAR